MDRQQHLDLGAMARAIIDSNLYLTLGTADENGRPWVSPVYYAPEGYAEFYWVSSPEATHSRNIAARPEVAIVVFDSRTPIGSGQGVYVSAIAEELTGADLDRGIAIFSRRSQAHGASEWTRDDVLPPARHRLYRATAAEHSVLGPQNRRTSVTYRGEPPEGVGRCENTGDREAFHARSLRNRARVPIRPSEDALHILTFSAHESGTHMVRGPFFPPRLRPRVALSAKTIVLPVMYG